jgi:hypothetical protein
VSRPVLPFNSKHNRGKKDEIPVFLNPVEDIFTGKSTERVHEDYINNKWYRTKFVPRVGKEDPASQDSETFIKALLGVIGVSIDVTEIKDKEGSLREQERENARLLANEAAAKEAS